MLFFITSESPDQSMRKRRPTGSSVGGDAPSPPRRDSLRNGILSQKQLRMFAHPMDSLMTDMSKEEPFQKVVRVSCNGKLMATGGADGCIRLWQFPAMKPVREIKAHTKEVDDLDLSPDCQKVKHNITNKKYLITKERLTFQMISVSRDATALIWNVNDGNKRCQLEWSTPNNAKYIFKRCRSVSSLIQTPKN